MTRLVYEQPREKLARKGATALSNAELLQEIIGSGNAKIPVAKIAKKVAKVLARSGPDVHPQELLAVPGVGIVRSGQILALFELATRFPTVTKSKAFRSLDSFRDFYHELCQVTNQSLLYVTFDGAYRLISKRQVVLDKNASVAKQVQKVFADCITDSATSVFIAIGSKDQPLEPELFELNFVRSIYKTAELLSVSVRLLALVSKNGKNILKESL